MEGRARARPNCTPVRPTGCGASTFNGGPGTCPAKPPVVTLGHQPGTSPSMEGRARARPNWNTDLVSVRAIMHLQWRAGHVPGQT